MSPIYGCTVSQHCTATFTKYGDWAQHEELAHAPSFDIWYCPCKQGYYNLNDFDTHFKSKHSELEFAPKAYLLGPSLGERFYCGFCKAIVNSDNRRWAGWNFSRQCHLRAHFENWDPLIEGTASTNIEMTIKDWEFLQIVPH